MSQNESSGRPFESTWIRSWSWGAQLGFRVGGCPCRPSLGYVPVPVPPPMGAIPTTECATRQIPTERGLIIAIYNLVSTSTYDLTVVIHPSPLHADLCLIPADWNRFIFRFKKKKQELIPIPIPEEHGHAESIPIPAHQKRLLPTPDFRLRHWFRFDSKGRGP